MKLFINQTLIVLAITYCLCGCSSDKHPESNTSASETENININTESILDKCERLLEANELSKIIELIDSLEDDKHTREILLYKARANTLLGNFSKALSELEKEPEKLTQFDTCCLALCYDASGMYEQSIKYYNIAIKMDPEFEWAYWALAQVQLKKYNYSEVIFTIKKYRDLVGETVKANRLLAFALKSKAIEDTDITLAREALSVYESLQEIEPSIKSYIERAELLIMVKEPESAIKELSQAIDLFPNNYELYLTRAKAFLNLDETDAAKEDFYNSGFLVQNDYYKLSWILSDAYESGLYDMTIGLSDMAIKLQPDKGFAFFMRALAFMAKFKHDEAILCLNKCIELGYEYNIPDDVKSKLDDEEIANMKNELDFQNAKVLLGVEYLMVGEYSKARKFLREFIDEHKSSMSTTYHYAGLAEFALKDYQNAIKYFRSAHDISEDYKERISAQCSIALCKYESGDMSYLDGFNELLGMELPKRLSAKILVYKLVTLSDNKSAASVALKIQETFKPKSNDTENSSKNKIHIGYVSGPWLRMSSDYFFIPIEPYGLEKYLEHEGQHRVRFVLPEDMISR